MQEHPLSAFARDFSGNDETVVAEVRTWLADPPIDERVIGFYGSEDYAPHGRVFLATVNLLDQRHMIDSVEDKYTIELFWRWCERGLVEVATLPPAARAVFGPLDRGMAGATMESVDEYVRACWETYARATEELEQQITARTGKVLLSIDATDGDTMFFALVQPHIATRWQGKALSVQDGYCAGVRRPMWDRFWNHLTYFSNAVEQGFSGYPPGTRRREQHLPFAE